ncbi:MULTISPECIES: hypothetical protein [Paenibacillus]|uniref:hypothetical protein n=1 Tax=Paenibacillus TaxID=44249 RepID=UPI001BD05704|nr:hypothetical protein [Paenibacillus dendritiformis]
MSAKLLNEVNDWYTIGMPDSLWILRKSDVPSGDYTYSEIKHLVAVTVWRKTREEYEAEEDAARRKTYPDIWGLQE